MLKRILIGAFALTICLSLFACGNKNTDLAKDQDAGTGNAATAEKSFILPGDKIIENSISEIKGDDGRMSVPRTSYDMFVNVDKQYYKIAMNIGEWLFPVELKAIDDHVNNISSETEFAALDTSGKLRNFSIGIDDRRVFDTQPDNCVRYTYNDWEFAIYKGNTSALGYYPLDNSYYLEADFKDILLDMPEDACKAFMESFSTSTEAKKLKKTGMNKIVLPKRFSSLKLGGSLSLNLVNNVTR